MISWSATCINANLTGVGRFVITGIELYLQVTTLSANDNAKLFQELKSGFKGIISLNEYQSKIIRERHKQYLDYLN